MTASELARWILGVTLALPAGQMAFVTGRFMMALFGENCYLECSAAFLNPVTRWVMYYFAVPLVTVGAILVFPPWEMDLIVVLWVVWRWFRGTRVQIEHGLEHYVKGMRTRDPSLSVQEARRRMAQSLYWNLRQRIMRPVLEPLARVCLSITSAISRPAQNPEKPFAPHEAPPASIERPHHYKFARTFLRNMIFGYSKADVLYSLFTSDDNKARDKVIKALWLDTRIGLDSEDYLSPDGLSVNNYRLDRSHQVLTVIIMPLPKYPGESYFCGITVPAGLGTNAFNTENTRYFTLLRSLGSEGLGTLVESFKDKREEQLKSGISPTLEGFTKAVEDALLKGNDGALKP